MAKKEEKTNSTEKLVEIVIDGEKLMLPENEVKVLEDFEMIKKSSKNGTNISVFKSEGDRHKWQKYIKKYLPDFAELAQKAKNVSEITQKGLAKKAKDEFNIFVEKFNKYHEKELNLDDTIFESTLRDISKPCGKDMLKATSEDVIFGLNLCRKYYEKK